MFEYEQENEREIVSGENTINARHNDVYGPERRTKNCILQKQQSRLNYDIPEKLKLHIKSHKNH